MWFRWGIEANYVEDGGRQTITARAEASAGGSSVSRQPRPVAGRKFGMK